MIPDTSPETVINRIASCGIILWGAEKTEEGTALYIHTKNVRKVKALYPDAAFHGRGMPAELRKFRKRAVLVILGIVLTGLWWVTGQLVWEFDVEGNENVSDFEILKVLHENGVTYGCIGNRIDSEKLSNIVLCEIPELAWFAVNVSGSRAQVLVRERIPVPEIVDPNELTNVYAEKSGVVTSVEVYDGTRLVSVGDEVTEGDMLVSGITASYTGLRTEHALARVYAETQYEYTASMPQKCSIKMYTGEVESRYAVSACGRQLGLYLDGESGFTEFDKSTKTRQFELLGATLPVSLVTTEYREFQTVNTELTAEECAEILETELSAKLRQETSGDILSAEFEVKSENGVVTVTLRAQVRERIA